MIVQIYEIQTPQETENCVKLGVDHIGCVLFSHEKETHASLKEVIKVTRETGAKSSLLPLFQDRDQVYRVIDQYAPDYIHFCQSLTNPTGEPIELEELVSFQADIKESFPEIGIIRTTPVPRKGLEIANFPFLDVVQALEEVSDFFLIDTWTEREPVKGFIGITGTVSDWDRAKEIAFSSTTPVILAGGISPENVYEAILKVTPAGVDSCTLTNSQDESGRPIRFQKDFTKVKRLVEEVRRAERDLRTLRDEKEQGLITLKEELREREAALPAHSIRPHQILAIEELEEEIAEREKEIRCLDLAISRVTSS
ncbi:MAG: hypothetical protein JRJ03_02470 [Deltaproteobacteria bacterium]|nr:hypothetical protein [Deltaproteobacteria bacterium]